MSEAEHKHRRQLAVAAALVALAAAAPYAGTLTHGFAFDDAPEVVRNHDVRSLANLPRFFTSGAWDGAGESNPIYRPLTTATYALNYAAAGLAPFGYHLANVALHVAVALLLLALALRLGLSVPLAGLAAALFAAHPIHVEVVANVAGRKDALAAGFAIAAVLLHETALRRGRFWLALPVLAIAGALFSKESGAAALAMVAAWDWFVGPERADDAGLPARRSRAVALYLLYAALFVLYLAARRAAVGSLGVPVHVTAFAENPLAHAPAATRILTAIAVQGLSLVLLVAPVSLSPDYSWNAIPLVQSAGDPRLLASVAALVALAVLSWRARRVEPALPFAAALGAAAALPASNLLLPVGTIFGERLLYLPSAGFCLWIAGAISMLAARPRLLAAATAAAAVAVAALGARAATYASVWSDELTLFAHAVRAQPASARAHQLHGAALVERDRVEEGAHELQLALDAMAGAPEVPPRLRVELGVALERLSKLYEARWQYETILRADPQHPEALWRLGVVQWRLGARDEAEQLWRRGVAAAPTDARILSDLGLAVAAHGQLAEAEAIWQRATQLDPRAAGPWLSLGNLAEARGDVARARLAWRHFLDNAKYGAYSRERAMVAAKLRDAFPP